MSRPFRFLLASLLVPALFIAGCGKSPASPDSEGGSGSGSSGNGSGGSTDNRIYIVDGKGVLATVDVKTGAVTIIGNTAAPLTDISFDTAGNLFGISYTDLYRINVATGAATRVGSHSVLGATALLGGTDGTLLSAGVFSIALWKVDPSTAVSTALGDMNNLSAGDLAFHEGNLYLSNTSDQLIKLNLANLPASSLVGAFGVPNMYGLASKGGVLYGVSRQAIYTINTTTGAATNPVSFAGKGLDDGDGLAVK